MAAPVQEPDAQHQDGARWTLHELGVDLEKARRQVRAADEGAEQVDLTRDLALAAAEIVVDRTPFAVLLLDSDEMVVRASAAAASVVHVDGACRDGQLVGELLRCVNSFGHGGCGRTSACGPCALRSAVAITSRNGTDVVARSSEMTFVSEVGPLHRKIWVSSMPVGDAANEYVLAVISDVEPLLSATPLKVAAK